MGLIESGARKKRRNRNIRIAILSAIGAAGIIAVAAVAPNIFQAFGKTGLLTRLKYQTKGVLTRLKMSGDIEFVERDGKRYARLTKQGEDSLAYKHQKMVLASTKQKRWDRRYRLVMFDIPERRKQVRDDLRRQMQEVGFLRIQDSAWVYPHDCEEFVTLLKAHMRIGKDVLYVVVEEIENDAWIRKHFNLPSKD